MILRCEDLSFHWAAPLFTNLIAHGWFPFGGLPILMTMVAVNFAFSGTELIGIAAGETENPHKVVPLAIRTTVVRLIVFFVGTVLVLAALIPMEEAGIVKSPFVQVFERIGIPYAADIFNFVILTAILSAANSGLYASGRMLWSLSNEKTLPACFSRLTRRGSADSDLGQHVGRGVGAGFKYRCSRYGVRGTFCHLRVCRGCCVAQYLCVSYCLSSSPSAFRALIVGA